MSEQISLSAWEYSAEQLSAAQYRAAGYTQAWIARKAGLSIRTLTRWESEIPEYQRLILELRADMMRSLEPKLGQLMHTAADVLIEALEGNLAGDDPRVQLARDISRESAFRLLRARAAAQIRAAEQSGGRGRLSTESDPD